MTTAHTAGGPPEELPYGYQLWLEDGRLAGRRLGRPAPARGAGSGRGRGDDR